MCQVVDSITGNYVDQFAYSKPYGWQPDMARQLATIDSYKAVGGTGYVPVPFETSGTPYAGAQRTLITDSSWTLDRHVAQSPRLSQEACRLAQVEQARGRLLHDELK